MLVFAAAAIVVKLEFSFLSNMFSLYSSINLDDTYSKLALSSSSVLTAAIVASYSLHLLRDDNSIETCINSLIVCPAFSSLVKQSSKSAICSETFSLLSSVLLSASFNRHNLLLVVLPA